MDDSEHDLNNASSFKDIITKLDGERGDRNVYFYTALLTKLSDQTYSSKPVGGWRIGISREEVKGEVFENLRNDFKDYAISELIVSELNLEQAIEGLTQ